MKQILLVIAMMFSITLSSVAEARKSSGYSPKSYSSKSTSSGYGTGSKATSTGVRGYNKQNGTYVAPARRSTPDSSKSNNWSTKPNTNPYTGKTGTRVTQ